MASVKEVDEKITAFWQYIEKSKVMESLEKAFTDLCNEPEKPRDILEYLKDKLGDKCAPVGTTEAIKKLLHEAKSHIKELQEQIKRAKEEKRYRERKTNFYKEKKKKIFQKEAKICADKVAARLAGTVSRKSKISLVPREENNQIKQSSNLS